MPPKGKKAGKGKKGKKKGKKGKPKGPEGGVAATAPDIVDKEEILQKELDQLTVELNEEKNKVDELRKETDWLQQESNKVRTESHEYMSYMEKKTTKRQTLIVSLSDANQLQIEEIKREKESMLQKYAEQKNVIQQEMLEKENKLARINQQLDELSEYKELQRTQLDRIKELEREVMRKRAEHGEALQKVKAHFLKQKRDFEHAAEAKVAAMTKQANQEAYFCLNEHTNSIKAENRKLRQELLNLIQQTNSLHEHRRHLQEQHKELLREQEYANDLKKLFTTRQHKVLNMYGMLEGKNLEAEKEKCEKNEKLEKELALRIY